MDNTRTHPSRHPIAVLGEDLPPGSRLSADITYDLAKLMIHENMVEAPGVIGDLRNIWQTALRQTVARGLAEARIEDMAYEIAEARKAAETALTS